MTAPTNPLVTVTVRLLGDDSGKTFHVWTLRGVQRSDILIDGDYALRVLEVVPDHRSRASRAILTCLSADQYTHYRKALKRHDVR